jgi:hypothetical protein
VISPQGSMGFAHTDILYYGIRSAHPRIGLRLCPGFFWEGYAFRHWPLFKVGVILSELDSFPMFLVCNQTGYLTVR